jgi:diguanylate cyclase (GGDEF)-like protein/PAS domain S-box-containing protein
MDKMDSLIAENAALRTRLAEAEETLQAIRSGEVDALVISGDAGEQVFTLQGADYPYRVLVEAMSEGALTLTTEGVIFYANRRFAEIIKTPLEQVIGATFARWIVPADQALFLTLLHLNSEQTRHQMEVALRAGDGAVIPCYLSLDKLDIEAAVGCSCLVITDLTEQKRTEAIMAAEKLARLILEQAVEAIVVCDTAMQIIRASQAAHTLCGANPLGQSFASAFPLQPVNGAAFSIAELLNAGHRRWIETWLERQGSVFNLLVSVGPLVDPQGEPLGCVITLTDITQRKAAEQQIEQLAFYDPLTRLPNRRLLLDRLHQVLVSSARSGRLGALLFIDLDNFKVLNDTLGHDIGDLLLEQVAQRLIDCVRAVDTVARLGGDEFVVMLEDLGEQAEDAAAQAQIVGAKILATLGQPYHLAGHHYHRSTPSLGATLIRNHGTTVDDLLKRADLAMYQAKAAGRNTLRFFDPAMQAVLETRTALEADLREGLRLGQFLLYYQPQVDDDTGLTGAEALVRWRHPRRGMVSPAEFIPLAEDTGLILPLGQWVLETACAQLAAWAGQPQTADLVLAVNVSSRQFYHPDFVAQVRGALNQHGADPRRLKLELTESLLLDNIEDTIAKMAMLKTEGVGFSLDDFGTGYSSLTYLKRLPLDQLKIDQSFIRDILTDPNDAVIARAIVALAHSLGLAVIAEGVETAAQRDFLIEHGCRAFQGYFYGRPGPVEALWGQQ